MTRFDPEDTGHLVRTLRDLHGWTRKEFAAQAGVSRSAIYRWEKGSPLSRKMLLRLAAGARVPMALIEERLLPAIRAARLAAHGALPPPLEAPEELPVEEDIGHVFATRLGAALADLETTLDAEPSPWGESRLPCAGDRDRVPALAETFLAAEVTDRELLVEHGPEFQTWAFAEWLAHESARVAADDAREALRLAKLAVRAAELATAEEKGPWRARLLGSVWPYVASARRVCNELDAAEAASRKAQALWKRGAGGDPAGLLAEWRLFDLEASLRRDQRRFEEALDLHGRAEALAPQAEAGRLLLNKGFTFEQMNAYERALATLEEAAPRIDAQREPRHRFGLCYNRAICLCHLGRAGEAARLLPEARRLAVQLDNRLDRVRLGWLEGRVSAGLGREEEARAAFEEARGELDQLGLPYDYALASLDLALLYRGQRRWPEIRALAVDMVEIFERHKIHREARAAMLLLQEAAVKEAVSVAFLRRLQEYLKEAQRRPGLRFVAGAQGGGRGKVTTAE